METKLPKSSTRVTPHTIQKKFLIVINNALPKRNFPSIREQLFCIEELPFMLQKAIPHTADLKEIAYLLNTL